MAGEEERRSYVVLRLDGLLLHTVPVTRWEARWLWYDAYGSIGDRRSRVRYLEEYGNVLDAGDYVERLGRLGAAYAEIYRGVAGFYEGPEELRRRVDEVFSDRTFGRLKRLPKARRVVEELLGKIEEFLRRPVEPKPIVAPVRYLEAPMHLVFGFDGALREVTPRPEWYAYHDYGFLDIFGISVFGDSFWLWKQSGSTKAVAVRRDAGDGDLVVALANDGAVRGFLKDYAAKARQVISEREEEMRERGYADVVRKAKVLLATFELLSAGRREEEGEALPA